MTIHGFQNEPIKEVEDSTKYSAADIQMDMVEIVTRTCRRQYQTSDRYKEFSRIICQWRHLKMLKQVGRGNDSHWLVAETKSGELAPSVNLPDHWEKVDKKFFFKYFLYLAEDCCFRLKRRLVSSEAKDPGLGTGASFFVEDEPFREYLKGVTDQQEMSTCTGLAALDHANTKFSQGYATTGVGLSVCARREFVMPNSVVDLQKGERYANMDYSFGSLLRYMDPWLTIVQLYDIVCQWSKNLYQHMRSMPLLVKENWPPKSLLFVIPKMHIPGHIRSCQDTFLLNWLPGAGRTDGEGIEQGWAHMGLVAASTQDMGPGNRHEVLNDHFAHWNWRKLSGLGNLLKKRMREAVAQAVIHHKSLADFSEG
ncbi:hypothetical protein BT96DRAFT_959629 [Gymnopus androsaceus JB14]|uniref:CxC2-like cysteine cluster KDZ transposase-associated domain-containing protein n=1 Tax=Gymnopus androsaceus JB14 TaxID=1447944 RepID=A0A6A4GZX6_9AGAR|nr:hypothetical protein BT96DRAFT_959629 [Gymnopus androsaceus JB14]